MESFANTHQLKESVTQSESMALMSQKRSQENGNFQRSWRQTGSVGLDDAPTLIACLIM